MATPPAERDLLLDLVRDALEAGQPAHALQLLDRLWGRDLSREECWFLRGQALYQLQRFLEAQQVTADGLAHAPDSAALRYLLCNCETRLGRLASAERAIVEALALLPDQPLLLCRYAHLLVRQRRYDEARQLVARVLEREPGHTIAEQERRYLDAAAAAHRGGEAPIAARQTDTLINETGDPYGPAAFGAALWQRNRVEALPLGLLGGAGGLAMGALVLRVGLVVAAVALWLGGRPVAGGLMMAAAIALPRSRERSLARRPMPSRPTSA